MKNTLIPVVLFVCLFVLGYITGFLMLRLTFRNQSSCPESEHMRTLRLLSEDKTSVCSHMGLLKLTIDGGYESQAAYWFNRRVSFCISTYVKHRRCDMLVWRIERCLKALLM